MENVLTPYTKSVLMPLWLTAEALAADACIQKKIFASGARASVRWNEEMKDLVKRVKSLEDSGILIKSVT